MLTRSQRRLTDQVPAPSLTEGVDWRELPTEVLMMILNQFKKDEEALHINPLYYETIPKLLNLRLVHPTWKEAMDYILEKTCVDFWTKWAPAREIDARNLYNFPILTLDIKRINICTKTPTKSLFIINRWRHWDEDQDKYLDDNQMTPMLRNAGFSSKLGEHLTSLSFYGMRENTTVKTFAAIVSQTPNLKALEFDSIRVKIMKRDLDNYSLSPLPHLTYLRVCDVLEFSKQDEDDERQNFKLINWIVSPYCKQLESFVTNEGFNWKGRNICFPKLKWLKIENPHISLMQSCIPSTFPSLKCLSITPWSFYDKTNKEGRMIPKLLLNLSNTLVDLFLNFYNYQLWAQQVEQIRVAACPNFSSLKTLWINMPTSEEKAVVVKKMLKWFPTLETLKLTHPLSFMDVRRKWMPTEENTTKLLEEKYWSLCPMLKTLLIYTAYDMMDPNPVVSSVAPFSTAEILCGSNKGLKLKVD